jgi:hypothetical protein
MGAYISLKTILLPLLLFGGLYCAIMFLQPSGKIKEGRFKGKFLREMAQKHLDEIESLRGASSKGLLGRTRSAAEITWTNGETSLADVDATTMTMIRVAIERRDEER